MHKAQEKAKLILGLTSEVDMCDYSLQHVKSRPAKIGDQLTTRDFGWGTRGFSASEDKNVAVCVLPGTELSFTAEVKRMRLWPWHAKRISQKTAIFRRINQHNEFANHDALEFSDGQVVLLTLLAEGQRATVLQLPAAATKTRARPQVEYGVNP